MANELWDLAKKLVRADAERLIGPRETRFYGPPREYSKCATRGCDLKTNNVSGLCDDCERDAVLQ